MEGHPAPDRPTRGVLRLAVVMVVAAVAGLAALVGTAMGSARPPVFLGAGLVVFLAATAAGVALATRKLPVARRGRMRLVALAVGGLGVAVFAVTVLVPVGDPRLPPASVAGQRWWQLPTGSRIAYVHLPADGRPRPTPVVFLHGGPGIADMAGDAASFGQLARDGFDLWVYDQVGTGRSSRLTDPRGYTIGRAGTRPGRRHRRGVRGRLSSSQQLGLYRLLLRPRMLLAYALLQVNPLAAHAFAGDAEMDARNDRSTTPAGPAPIVAGCHRGRRCMGWASTPSSSRSRPPPAPGLTRGPSWRG